MFWKAAQVKMQAACGRHLHQSMAEALKSRRSNFVINGCV